MYDLKQVKECFCNAKYSFERQKVIIQTLFKFADETIHPELYVFWIKNSQITRFFFKLIKSIVPDISINIAFSDTRKNTFLLLIKKNLQSDALKSVTSGNFVEQKYSFVTIFLLFGQFNFNVSKAINLGFYTRNYDEFVFLKSLIKKYYNVFNFYTYKNKNFIYCHNQSLILALFRDLDQNMLANDIEDEINKHSLMLKVMRSDQLEMLAVLKTANYTKNLLNLVAHFSSAFLENNLNAKELMVLDLKIKNPQFSLNELVIEYQKKYQKTISKTNLHLHYQSINKKLIYELKENKL